MAEQPPSAKGSATSIAAAESMKETASTLRSKVLEAIRRSDGGLTTDEVEQLLSLNHQTASPRMWELHKRGLIGDSGNRRKTRSGRMAVVYRAISTEEIATGAKQAVTAARKTAVKLTEAAEELDLISKLQRMTRGRPQ